MCTRPQALCRLHLVMASYSAWVIVVCSTFAQEVVRITAACLRCLVAISELEHLGDKYK
jgi:hypothetical protein